MDLMKILRSFEEFLFEAVTWLYFYPRTLARIVRRPLAMMDYADAEEAEPEENRFNDGLSPPVLLLISLVLANTVGWAAHIDLPPDAAPLSQALFNSQQNLLFFRCLIFSLIPLVAALTLLNRQGAPVSRETLRRPFYAQCYLAAPFALAVSLGGIGLQRGGVYAGAGLAAIVLFTAWLLVVQSLWFRERLGLPAVAAFGAAAWALLRAIAYNALIVVPVVLL